MWPIGGGPAFPTVGPTYTDSSNCLLSVVLLVLAGHVPILVCHVTNFAEHQNPLSPKFDI